MSVDKLPSGKWRARYRADGRQYSKSFDRKQDALRWETVQLAAAHRGQHTDPSDRTTVHDYAAQWAASRPIGN